MASDASNQAGWGRTGRRLLALFGATTLCALLVEGAVRLRQYWVYGATTSFYEFVEDPGTGLRVPAPGVVEGRNVLIEVNADGFRNPALEQPKPPGRLRLAFLGGSTTFCAEASDNSHTWPALVTARLAERFPNTSFDYANASAGGMRTPHSLTNLRHRVAALEPDVIVVYHATNDLSLDTRTVAAEAGLVELTDLEPSWLERHSVAWMLLRKNIRAARSANQDAAPAGGLIDFEALGAGFEDQLGGLLSEAREVAPLVVVPTFATRQRGGQSPEELRAASVSSRYYMPYLTPEEILEGFESYDRALRRAVAGAGALLVEGQDAIPPTAEYFVDSCHFTDRGCELQAARVVEALATAPEFLALLDD